jgi:thiamine-phosphate pyrophosphorylase
MHNTPCRLYLITPPRFVLTTFVEQFKQACDGGDIASLQIRLKEADNDTPQTDDAIKKATDALLPLCRAHDIALIINDRPNLVKSTGADGVHVGQSEDSIARNDIAMIRKQLGDHYVIGASCYGSRDLAMAAGEQGADYVSFGAFYETQTKTPKGRPSPDLLTWWTTHTELPACAIGGIKPDNCEPLVRAGANFIAVVTGVWDYPEGPKAAVEAYNVAISKGLSR